jgi:acetylornithine/succinyldiaminopimelate/putrescine aminotransferase
MVDARGMIERRRRMDLRRKDHRFVARDGEPDEVEVVRSQGSFLVGPRGRRYIDFTAGWCVGNLGWGNDAIRAAVDAFDGPEYVAPSYLYRPWAELAELLATITPGKLTKSFRATGGTEAVEIALNAAMSHTQRTKFVAIEGSYHGDSIATMSLGGPGLGRWPRGAGIRSVKVAPPLGERAASKVEALLERRDVAAFVMEPILCNLGVVIPERGFMRRVQGLCRRYGTLLVMDEVATGFGRTGTMFASEQFGIEPDILCVAKAITGGYAPLGATVVTEAVAASMEYDTSFYSTYGWYPRSVAAALAAVRYLVKHRRRIEEHTARMSDRFRERLSRMRFRRPAEIRIRGLAIGVEFDGGGYATEIAARARDRGLLLSEEGDALLTIFPALNIEPEVAEKGLDLLERCL